MRTPVTVGVVGLDASGQRLARALVELPQADVRWLCDAGAEVQLRLRPCFPHARFTSRVDDLLRDEALDAIVVAPGAVGGAGVTELALEAEKHVLVAGPLGADGGHAAQLARLAARRNRRLLAADPVLFHPALRKLRELLELDVLGEVFYLVAARSDPAAAAAGDGLLRTLAAQEVAAVVELLGDEPVEAIAHGESYVRGGDPDVLFCRLRFATGIVAQLRVSALEPQPVSRLSVVAARRSATCDFLAPLRPLTVVERGGDATAPLLEDEDPVRAECEQFLAAVRSPRLALAAGRGAAAVSGALEALERSLDRGGGVEEVAVEGDAGGQLVRLPRRG